MTRKRKKKSSSAPKGFLLLVGIFVFCYFWFMEDIPDLQAPSVLPDSSQVSEEILSDRQEGGLDVWFLDVGQGDSILLNCGDSWMLVDTGPGSAGSTVSDFLLAADVERLNYLVLTHPHEDHIGNACDVLNTTPVGCVYLSPEDSDSEAYMDVMELVDVLGVDTVIADAGDTFYLGDAEVFVVSPSRDYDDVNDDSLVLKVVYGDTSFLLTGDAESPAESDMYFAYDISADVLKVGHHGSANSSTRQFLNAVDPSLVVISVGEENRYGHPTEEALSRLERKTAAIYRTDENGVVYMHSDGAEINVVTEK